MLKMYQVHIIMLIVFAALGFFLDGGMMGAVMASVLFFLCFLLLGLAFIPYFGIIIHFILSVFVVQPLVEWIFNSEVTLATIAIVTTLLLYGLIICISMTLRKIQTGESSRELLKRFATK